MALAQLQSDAPPMSVDLAIETVERELRGALDELFVEFDPERGDHAVQMLVRRVLRQFGLDEASPLVDLEENNGGHGRSFPAPGWRPVKGAKSEGKNRKRCWRAHTPQMK